MLPVRLIAITVSFIKIKQFSNAALTFTLHDHIKEL